MTVGELKKLLNDYSDNADVVISFMQPFSIPTASKITNVVEQEFTSWYEDKQIPVVALVEGDVIGTLNKEV